eukprot:526663_1
MGYTSYFIITVQTILQSCKTILNYTGMVIIIIFAFVPILCLFTWMIPLFVLERIIPIQFHAFILHVPLIVWCTLASTIVLCIMFSVSYCIDRPSSMSSIQYLRSQIKHNELLSYALAYLLAMIVLSALCSFVFCVSPALYLCALFWILYEMQRQSDTNNKEQQLEIRQYLYHSCFSIFDDTESAHTTRIKQFAHHLFSLLLCIKRINSDAHTHPLPVNPSLVKSYIKCLQNNCESCDHKWDIDYTKIPDLKSFICIEIGAALLIISHLFLFWFWTIYYSQEQVHHMQNYSQLLVYYVVEHSCIVIVFVAAAKIYLTDIIEYHAFEFLNLNNDAAAMETLDEDMNQEDSEVFVATYSKLLYIYLEQWITTQMLRLYIKDEWLWSSLSVFLCGDKRLNILNDKELMELLDQCLVSDSCSDNQDRTEEDIELIEHAHALHSLSEFVVYFNSSIHNLASNIQCSTKK